MEDNRFTSCEHFDWDDANVDKKWQEHGVAFWECEEVFFNKPLVIQEDTAHSLREQRDYALGQTNSGRRLFVVFTIRDNLIRVISAREMTRKENRFMSNTKKKIPPFKIETQEREFWKKQDSTTYMDWPKAKKVLFPNLKPTLRTISLRLPESMIAQLKVLANKRDVPYQSLMKIFLAERLAEEK